MLKALTSGYNSEYVIADTAYDSMAFIESIIERGAVPVIPPRANRRDSRTYDVHLYKERHLVECFINKMKQYRRISSQPVLRAGEPCPYGLSSCFVFSFYMSQICLLYLLLFYFRCFVCELNVESSFLLQSP